MEGSIIIAMVNLYTSDQDHSLVGIVVYNNKGRFFLLCVFVYEYSRMNYSLYETY